MKMATKYGLRYLFNSIQRVFENTVRDTWNTVNLEILYSYEVLMVYGLWYNGL